MKLSEQIRNYDRDIMSVLKDSPLEQWADEVAKLERVAEAAKQADQLLYALAIDNIRQWLKKPFTELYPHVSLELFVALKELENEDAVP